MDFVEIKTKLIECLVTLKNNDELRSNLGGSASVNEKIKLNTYLLHLQTIIDEIKNVSK